jgi:hypothetical protein
MAKLRASALAGAAAAALCALALLCSGTVAANNVIMIDGHAAFDAALATHDLLVVDFYAPVRLRRRLGRARRRCMSRHQLPSAACMQAR